MQKMVVAKPRQTSQQKMNWPMKKSRQLMTRNRLHKTTVAIRQTITLVDDKSKSSIPR